MSRTVYEHTCGVSYASRVGDAAREDIAKVGRAQAERVIELVEGLYAMERPYTIGNAAAELGMPASTIRFYEKNGLIPNQQRSSDGRRLFDEDDLEWIRFVERLKVSGIPIREIREYIRLYMAGDSTIEECRRIVYERRDAIDRQLKELELTRDFIEYKCWFYDVARESGTCDTPRTMPYDEPPDDIRHREARCGTPGMTARSGYPGRAYALGRSV